MAAQSLRRYLRVPLQRGVYARFSPRGRSAILSEERLRREAWERRIEIVRKRLPERRERIDPLIQLLRGWAEAELKPISYRDFRFKREVIYRERVTDIPMYRHRLTRATREMVALAEYGFTVAELVRLAAMGDASSLFCLVQLNKVFITADFAQKWITIAASRDDAAFFGGLAKALQRDTYHDHKQSVRRAIAIYLLWFLGFEGLPHKDLKKFLVAERLDSHGSPGSTGALLHRLGLSKPRAMSSSKKPPKTR